MSITTQTTHYLHKEQAATLKAVLEGLHRVMLVRKRLINSTLLRRPTCTGRSTPASAPEVSAHPIA